MATLTAMSDAVDAVVAEIAHAIDADLAARTTELTDWFVEMIPEFRHDETVRKLMIASTSANLVAILDMLSHSIPLDRITVPPAAAEYARRFAQHELSLEALLRAYRLGEHRFEQWAIEALERQPNIDTQLALGVLAELSRRTNRYIDQVIEGLIDIFETERRRWSSRTGAARAAQIRLVLDSDTLTEDAAQQLLAFPMRQWHCAAVAWLPAEGAGELQAAARLLQEVCGRGPALTMLADDRTLWSWTVSTERDDIEVERLRAGVAEIGGGLRLALGAPGYGLPGFRGSLREAVRARAVAETDEDQSQNVVLFDDVAIAALLTEHSDDVYRWIARVLGDLVADDPGTEQLRETLRVFLDTDGSYTHAAARLHLHKNTVHYRVRKAEELCGRPLAEHRLEVEVALRAATLLRKRLPWNEPG
ncbi:DNA-binding PucR family transcriptional regulator [Amycolatopsis echigonensis]|uniref:DNA-binding PucR family transcriptional regulator n=2 Tax=Amycolatopsis echigonensis TaxID=2576905 RepID=A0A2N3WKX5_9PSEU|nr:DNA-binding PucR family transcriptional regulator [Amycolatopsis niigatensis]